MAAGLIVIPLAAEEMGGGELERLAKDAQATIPFASHWLDDPALVRRVVEHLNREGHEFPGCLVCP